MSARGSDSLESFAHIEAKRLLLSWLRDSAAEAGRDGLAFFCGQDGIEWRVNRGEPHFGVWEEYPVLSDGTGISPVWDESDDRWISRPPTYEDVVAGGFRPMVVLDIAIQHKGTIAYAVEVVHKHRCDWRKKSFLCPLLTLVEIPAYWVLGQVGRPQFIPPEFFL
jgi:hypothetical protein